MESNKKLIRRPHQPVGIEPDELLARRRKFEQAWGPASRDFDSVVLGLQVAEAKKIKKGDTVMNSSANRGSEDPDACDHVEELRDLRNAVYDLHDVLVQACDGIEELTTLVYDRLHPDSFPEPSYEGPTFPQQELSSNGLMAFHIAEEDDDVPF